jgi:hypothetical protein
MSADNFNDIIRRRLEGDRQHREGHDAWLADQGKQAEFLASGNAVEDLGSGYLDAIHDLHPAKLQSEEERQQAQATLAGSEAVRGWVATMAAYKQALGDRNLLGRLTNPPPGAVPEDGQDAYQLALDIFTVSDSDPAKAAAMLARLAVDLPAFAADVMAMLRKRIRLVVNAPDEFWRPAAVPSGEGITGDPPDNAAKPAPSAANPTPPSEPPSSSRADESRDAVGTEQHVSRDQIAADLQPPNGQQPSDEGGGDSPPPGEPENGPGEGLPKPRKLLTGWHEITATLEMKHQDREKIKSLNERFEGPIKNKGSGTSPMVYQEELIEWWNHLAVKQQEMANYRDGRKLSAEAQHNYGRDGTAAPEIGGGVNKRRKRRRDQRT